MKIVAPLVLAASALASSTLHASVLKLGDTLTITPGAAQFDSYGRIVNVTAGSYFGADLNGNKAITANEKAPLAQGTTGIVIGQTSTPGANHTGLPLPGDSNAVTAPTAYFSNTGSFYFDIAPVGGTDAGLDMRGWRFAWAGVPNIPLGDLAWQPTNCADLGCTGHSFANGLGWLRWSGIYGDAYALDYTATIPPGDPSGLGGIEAYFHFEGHVLRSAAVPEPGALGLVFAGALPWLAFAARRRKTG